MNNNLTQSDSKKKSQVVTFRIPYELYEAYEVRCIEEHILMAEILRQAVKDYVNQKN